MPRPASALTAIMALETSSPAISNTPSPSITLTPTLLPMVEFQKGVSFESGQAGGFSSQSSDVILADKIKPMGANSPAVTVTCYQETIHSTEIECKSGLATASQSFTSIASARLAENDLFAVYMRTFKTRRVNVTIKTAESI